MDTFRDFLQACVKNRNKIFFLECFIVHALYAIYMASVEIWFISVSNIVSAVLYLIFLFLFREKAEIGILVSYLEILIFSIVAELSVGSGYGFYLFAFGMVASLFFLIPSLGKKRFTLQILGAVIILGVELVIRIWGIKIPIFTGAITSSRQTIFLINLSITLSLIVENGILFATENDQIRKQLRYNMNHDPLTDLYNRRYFEEWAHNSESLKNEDFAIAMMDIDDFKKINDTYGHEAGDVALVKLSAAIKELVGRENGHIGDEENLDHLVTAIRWGGEEFIILFPNRNAQQIVQVMEALRESVSLQIVEGKDGTFNYHVTIGLAEGKAGSNYEKVIKQADNNLYVGKKNGKNQVVV